MTSIVSKRRRPRELEGVAEVGKGRLAVVAMSLSSGRVSTRSGSL